MPRAVAADRLVEEEACTTTASEVTIDTPSSTSPDAHPDLLRLQLDRARRAVRSTETAQHRGCHEPITDNIDTAARCRRAPTGTDRPTKHAALEAPASRKPRRAPARRAALPQVLTLRTDEPLHRPAAARAPHEVQRLGRGWTADRISSPRGWDTRRAPAPFADDGRPALAVTAADETVPSTARQGRPSGRAAGRPSGPLRSVRGPRPGSRSATRRTPLRGARRSPAVPGCPRRTWSPRTSRTVTTTSWPIMMLWSARRVRTSTARPPCPNASPIGEDLGSLRRTIRAARALAAGRWSVQSMGVLTS